MPPFPSSFGPEQLSEVYANVVDHGAGPLESSSDNCAAIQEAIDTRRHVLFPGHTYRFRGVLTFGNAAQQCTFLAGAILVPADDSSYVVISGEQQAFDGLRIEAEVDEETRCPVLEIYGASNLVMRGLEVSVTNMLSSVPGPRAAVRVMGLTNCQFFGGLISGGAEAGTVGLWLASSYDYFYADENGDERRGTGAGEWSNPLSYDHFVAAKGTSGAYQVSVVGLRIDAFGWAVRVGCITDNPKFVSCVFADNADGALVVTGDGDVVSADPWTEGTSTQLWECPTPTSAYGLTLVDCHIQGGAAQQCVEIAETCRWVAGAVIGCTFGFFGSVAPEAEIDLGDTRVRPLLGGALAQPGPTSPADSSSAAGAGVLPSSLGTKGAVNASNPPSLANTGASVSEGDVSGGANSTSLSSQATDPPGGTVGRGSAGRGSAKNRSAPAQILPPGILATLAQTSRTGGVLATAASASGQTGSQSPMARLLGRPSMLPQMARRRASAASPSTSSTGGAKSVIASSRSRLPSGSARASVRGIGGTVAMAGTLPTDLAAGIAPAPGIHLGGADSRCIFRIEGIVAGVLVNGCQSDAGIADYVWDVPESGALENTGDAFNAWAQSVVAVGSNAGLLVQLSTNLVSVVVDPTTSSTTEVVELTVCAPTVSLAASKHGFFGTDPVDQATTPFDVSVPPTRSLSSSADVAGVLAQLIADLAALGLIKQGSS